MASTLVLGRDKAALIMTKIHILIVDNIFKDMEIYDVAFLLDYMRDWALKMKRIVIVAMAPPSMEILEMFSKVAILCSGRLSYFGTAVEMIPYFEEKDYPCPLYKNPCDYYVDLVTHDHLTSVASRESSRRIEKICSLWNHRPRIFSKHQKVPMGPKIKKAGTVQSITLVYKWHWLNCFNRPLLLFQEPLLALSISLILSIFFYSLTNNQRVSINNRQGLISAVTLYGMLPISFIWVQEVYRTTEMLNSGRKSGFFDTLMFVTANILFDFPLTIVSSLCYVTPIYFISGYASSTANELLYCSYMLPIMFYYLIQRIIVQSIAQLYHSRTTTLTVSSIFMICQHLFSGVPLILKNSYFIVRIVQPFTISYVVAKELMEQHFLGTSFVDSFFFSAYNQTELIIACKPREVLVQKIKELPVYIVEPCSKFRGSQVFAFHDFVSHNTDVLGFSFTFVVVISWLTLATLMLFCTAMFRKRTKR